MKRKQFEHGSLKLLQEEGEFECVFATLGVVDKDGDIIAKGALKDGQGVRISSWGHDWGKLPVGKGTVYERGNQAVCEGKFFLDTQGGAETYRTVKGLGELQEWSFGFDILDSERTEVNGEKVRVLRALEIFEVSPVLLGAGVGTHTERIKTEKEALTTPSGLSSTTPRDTMLNLDTELDLAEMGAWAAKDRKTRTPAAARRAALELMDPADVKALADDDLFEADAKALEAKLTEDGVTQTNRDVLREQMRRAWPDADEAYIDAQVSGALHDMAWQLQQENRLLDPITAWQRVVAWAQRRA